MSDQQYVIWRFVAHEDEITRLIIAATCKTGGQVAHAEAIMRGGTVIGAFAEGGVQERKCTYVNGKFELYDGGQYHFEQLIAIPVDSDTLASFEHFLRAVVAKKEGYDFFGLGDFVQMFGDWHHSGKVFCSALITDAARWKGMIFKHPLPINAHGVSPIMLQQMALARDDAQIVTRDSDIFKAHISAARETGA